MNNVSELGNVGAFQKNVEKSNTGGYHTPPPPNYSNSILNQPHPNVNLNATNAPPPPTQYAYITSMIGTPNANMVHTGMQQVYINLIFVLNSILFFK